MRVLLYKTRMLGVEIVKHCAALRLVLVLYTVANMDDHIIQENPILSSLK